MDLGTCEICKRPLEYRLIDDPDYYEGKYCSKECYDFRHKYKKRQEKEMKRKNNELTDWRYVWFLPVFIIANYFYYKYVPTGLMDETSELYNFVYSSFDGAPVFTILVNPLYIFLLYIVCIFAGFQLAKQQKNLINKTTYFLTMILLPPVLFPTLVIIAGIIFGKKFLSLFLKGKQKRNIKHLY